MRRKKLSLDALAVAYTANASCAYDSYDDSCGCTQAGCPSYPLCVSGDEC